MRDIPAALTFLEKHGWSPRRARAAWAAYQAQPDKAHREDATRTMDSVLEGFRASLEHRALEEHRLDRLWDGAIRHYRRRSEEAGALMNRKPRPCRLNALGLLRAEFPPAA